VTEPFSELGERRREVNGRVSYLVKRSLGVLGKVGRMMERMDGLGVYWINMLPVRFYWAFERVALVLMVDFPQEGFEKQDPLPFVELQYPAVGCREK
jgi:hypothetical protein